MKNKNKTARKPLKDFLSVVPVTSRDETGTEMRHKNMRAALIIAYKRNVRIADKALKMSKRLNAAIKALGKVN